MARYDVILIDRKQRDTKTKHVFEIEHISFVFRYVTESLVLSFFFFPQPYISAICIGTYSYNTAAIRGIVGVSSSETIFRNGTCSIRFAFILG